jgi:hypothetical protein
MVGYVDSNFIFSFIETQFFFETFTSAALTVTTSSGNPAILPISSLG